MDDLISREAAIHAVNAYDYRGFPVEDVRIITDGCAEELRKLPSIEAEPVRTGRWIHDINNLYACSECLERETMSPKRLKPYCPNCGVKMDLEESNENA